VSAVGKATRLGRHAPAIVPPTIELPTLEHMPWNHLEARMPVMLGESAWGIASIRLSRQVTR
jgi:hypothetical protein